MRTSFHSASRRVAALLSGALLLIPVLAATAAADPPPWAQAHGWRSRGNYGRYAYAPPPRYVIVRHTNTVVFRPAFTEAYVVRRPRFVVVQPVPVWAAAYHGVSGAVGIHTGGLNLNFAFSKQRPYYGCSFCGTYFNSYDAWARHEQVCPDAPPGRVLCQPWQDGQLDQCRDQAGQAWSQGDYDDQGYGDDRRYDDRGYQDDRSYQRDDQDDRGYRHGDPSYRGGDQGDQGDDDDDDNR